MRKFLRFYLLNRLVKNPVITSQIYHMMYQDGLPPKDIPVILSVDSNKLSESPKAIPTRKQQLEESLRYLKSKIDKSKQDKESIGVIEAILKNER